jgi:hypothetical protein
VIDIVKMSVLLFVGRIAQPYVLNCFESAHVYFVFSDQVGGHG